MAGPPDLLSSIGLCVSVAALLALLANRLRQPLLLAYLLAGVLIGPQIGLGLISGEESIRTVSEIGLILLLFIIGLEMDLTSRGMGMRSQRYSMLVQDGVVKAINVEAPGKFEVSNAETMLKALA